MTFKPFREVSVEDSEDMSSINVVDSVGNTVLIDVFCDTASVNRFVECWNALRHVAFPASHVKALEERVERLETLRKEAWATAEKLAVASAIRDLPSEVRFIGAAPPSSQALTPSKEKVETAS